MRLLAFFALLVAGLSTGCGGEAEEAAEGFVSGTPGASSTPKVAPTAEPATPTATMAEIPTPPTAPPVTPGPEPTFTDQDLIAAAYAQPKWWPAIATEGHGYYVNSNSIAPLNNRPGTWIELCSNDRSQARQWAMLTDQNSSVHGKMVSERSTDKFHEFRLEFDPDTGSGPGLMRVYRCDYFQPTQDFLSPEYQFGDFPEAVLGLFNATIDLSSTQELADHLWFKRWSEFGGASYVANRAYESDSGPVVEIYYTTRSSGDSGLCVEVGLNKWTLTVSDANREVRVRQERLRHMTGVCHPNPISSS
jgi:hypothetical protein